MFSSLKIRDFRIYWAGMLVSLIGTWIQSVSQSWLVFQLTNSAFLLGLVGFLSAIPMFFLTAFAGVVADRVNKRAILLVTQNIFMVLAFALGLLTQLQIVQTWHIMVIALLNGAVMAFDAPSRQAMVVELVGKKHLMNAIALNSAAFNSARIIGPALGGVFVAVIGMSGCFYLNGVSFLAVIFALLSIRNRHIPREPQTGSWVSEVRDALRYIRAHRQVLLLLVIMGIMSLFGLSYIILMPLFAERVLHTGIRGLGALMSAAGCGALLAALLLARRGDFPRKGRLLAASSLVFGAALTAFACSHTVWLSLALLMLVGWGAVTTSSLINTLLQATVPDHIRGRIMSAFLFTFAGLMPFGNLLGGWLAHQWGVSAAVAASGLICVFFFVVIPLRFPQMLEL
jgi:MFS family permease